MSQPSVKISELEETFSPRPSEPVYPITQDECKGLTTLPSELLFEIVDCFPDIPVTVFRMVGFSAIRHSDAVIHKDYRLRFATLRALSQTCKKLRALILPLAWNRLEVCAYAYGFFNRGAAARMQSKCTGLLQSPHLIPYVRIVTISLGFDLHERPDALLTFVKCLQALINLHTIQIYFADNIEEMDPRLEDAFEGCIFPSVRTVILPCIARDILRRCPNVEDVSCSDIEIYTKFRGDKSDICNAIIDAKLTNLKALRHVTPSEAIAKSMAEVAPNLQFISVICAYDSVPLNTVDLQGFQNFKNLDTIELIFRVEPFARRVSKEYQRACCELGYIAIEVLEASKSMRKKYFKASFLDGGSDALLAVDEIVEEDLLQ